MSEVICDACSECDLHPIYGLDNQKAQVRIEFIEFDYVRKRGAWSVIVSARYFEREKIRA
jgi:hypothetical protein